jgi:chromate transporter
MLATMSGILLPSTTLTYLAARWGQANRELRAVRAFKLGLAPIVIALLIATGWILASAHQQPAQDWPLWLLTLVCTLIVWRTRLHLLWLLAGGALLGWFGLV